MLSYSTCGGIIFSGAATIAFITAILTAVTIVGDLDNFNVVAILIMLSTYTIFVSLFLSCALSAFIAPRNAPRKGAGYQMLLVPLAPLAPLAPPEPSFEELSRLPELPRWLPGPGGASRLPGAAAAAAVMDSDDDTEPLLRAPAPPVPAPRAPPPRVVSATEEWPTSAIAACIAISKLSLFTTVLAIVFTFTIVGMGVVDSDADRIAVICGVSYFSLAMLIANALTVLIATNSGR